MCWGLLIAILLGGCAAAEKPMGSLWDDVDAQELEAMLPTPSVAAASAAEMAVAEAATAAEEKTAVQQFLFPDKEELPDGNAHPGDRVSVNWEVSAVGKRG